MAFIINPQAQITFFSKVFGPKHETTHKAQSLINAGTKFDTGLYNLTAKSAGGASQVALSVGATSLMKNTVELPILLHNQKLVSDWISGLYHDAGLSPVPVIPAIPVSTPLTILGMGFGEVKPNLIVLIKAIRTVTGGALKEAKEQAEQIIAGVAVGLGTFPTLASAEYAAEILKKAGVAVSMTAPVNVKPIPFDAASFNFDKAKPVDAVIKLKDAKALGQKVHGTSPGSIYRCIALSEHLRVAAKLLSGGSISIRAEWTGDPKDELNKLTEVGVIMKGGYGSIHFDAANVPIQRVIGAFLVGTGINWKAAVMNGADLIIGGAIMRDSMRIDAPVAKTELALLQSMKVGDIRRSTLFPALDVELEWELMLATESRWEFDGRFVGVPLCRLSIEVQAGLLTLEAKEIA